MEVNIGDHITLFYDEMDSRGNKYYIYLNGVNTSIIVRDYLSFNTRNELDRISKKIRYEK